MKTKEELNALKEEFEQLKKTLEDANNENDKLEALDRYSHKLSDDELESVIGGIFNQVMYTVENCPGQVSCFCSCCPEVDKRTPYYKLFCPITNTGFGDFRPQAN